MPDNPAFTEQIKRAEIVEIHGEPEHQGPGTTRWGFALYDHHLSEVIAGPLYRSREEAQAVIDETIRDWPEEVRDDH